MQKEFEFSTDIFLKKRKLHYLIIMKPKFLDSVQPKI